MSEQSFVLTVRRGEHTQAHTFRQAIVIVGRSKEADLRLDDRLVSRRHCRVEVREGRFWLIDEGAQNTTKLRGNQVQSEPGINESQFMMRSCC